MDLYDLAEANRERAELEKRADVRGGIGCGNKCGVCGDNIWSVEDNPLTDDREPTIMTCVNCGNKVYS